MGPCLRHLWQRAVERERQEAVYWDKDVLSPKAES